MSFAWLFSPIYIWLAVSECYHSLGEYLWQMKSHQDATHLFYDLRSHCTGCHQQRLRVWFPPHVEKPFASEHKVAPAVVLTGISRVTPGNSFFFFFFLYLLDICVPSLEKCLLKPYGHFKLDCLSFDCHVSLTLSLGHLSFFYFYCCLENLLSYV